MTGAAIPPLALYVHWPFCRAKCPYCDFNSHVAQDIDEARFASAYRREMQHMADRHGRGRNLVSVFFGGGTPSLMHPDTVAAIVEGARRYWPFANDVEITLEANPGSVEAGRFSGYRDGGVNRVSMGIQALNDTDLRRLGRIHTVAEARAAFDIARDCFDRVSFDLIYARQDQTVADWEAELRTALSMAVDHLSVYQLTIEQGTAFGDRYNAGKLRGLPDDDRAADMYALTQAISAEFGIPRYEVSNHARDGAQSRHNLIYWRYGDYAGIGPGAHGRLTIDGKRYATETHRAPGAWLEAARQGSGETVLDALTPADQADEYAMMSLRLAEGMDEARYERLAGRPLDERAVQNLIDLGMIARDNGRIVVQDQGFMILNTVLAELLAA